LNDYKEYIPENTQILIIEDNISYSGKMASILQDQGIVCHCLPSGREALAWLSESKPALIILEYALPDMTGESFVQELGAKEFAIPFIMITGRDDASLAVHMMQLGACDFRIKNATFLERLPAIVARALHEVETRDQLRRAEDFLRQSEARLARAQKIAGMGSWEWNIKTGDIFWSDQLFHIFGLEKAAQPNITMEWVFSLVHPTDLPALKKVMLVTAKSGKPFNIVYRINSATDGEIVVNSQGEVSLGDDGKPLLVSATTLDITARIRAESEIQQLINYDTLTGLPNRSLLHDRLKLAIAQAARENLLLGVLILDLDRFKDINDSLGHHVGDKLLKTVSKRLAACVRETDTLARLGGDEFVAILVGVHNIDGITTVAKKVLGLIAEPVYMEGHEIYTTGSIGIAVYPMDGEDSQTLLKHADLAMYQAKELDRNNFQFFSRDMNIKMLERMMLENSMRKALDREDFFLVYQPQVDARTGKITGMEALLRWQHPDLGLLSPDKFIYLAEETGFIVAIGEWVLRTACRQNKQWQDMGLPSVRMAVNLSAKQFVQKGLDETISAILLESGLDPQWLELEITESAVMKNADENAEILRKFRDMGSSIAIDDFGTGYSSLSYLKHFPITRLKIDRSFVRDITSNPDDAAIAEIIIAMAQTLKLEVIAEGVETRTQMEFLSFNNCVEMQGYLFSRPVRADVFENYLRNGLNY